MTRMFRGAMALLVVLSCLAGVTGFDFRLPADAAISLTIAPDPVEAGKNVTFSMGCPSKSNGLIIDLTSKVDASRTGFALGTKMGSDQSAEWAVPTDWPLGLTEAAVICSYEGFPPLPTKKDFTVKEGTGSPTPQPNAASSTSLAASPTTAGYGEQIVFTATVTANNAPVTGGTVNFNNQQTVTTIGANIPVGQDGKATFSTSTLPPGNHTIGAVYSGTQGVDYSVAQQPVSVTVGKASTTTAVSMSPVQSVSGEAVMITATVTGSAQSSNNSSNPLPTGSVTLELDGTPVSGNHVLTNGTVSVTAPVMSVGDHLVKATYLGDDKFDASTGESSHSVDKADATVLVTTDPGTSVYGQSVAVGVTVGAKSPATGTPPGLVSLNVDGEFADAAPVALSNGQASFDLTGLAIGDHTVKIRYSGDDSFNSAWSAPVQVSVGKADTATTLQVNPVSPSVSSGGVQYIDTSSAFGQSVKLQAHVAVVSPGHATVLGSVKFYSGQAFLGSDDLDETGHAALEVSDLAVDEHSLKAVFGGNDELSGSSDALAHTVNAAGTSTVLELSADKIDLGDTVNLTATIAAVAPGAGIPAGDVEFRDGDELIGTVPLDEAGKAVLVTKTLPRGERKLSAGYTGSSQYKWSTSEPVALQVNPAPTKIKLAAKPSLIREGGSVTMTASVSPAVAPGTVTFYDGDKVLGTASLTEGTASLTTAITGVGRHSLTARYDGTDDYLQSKSSAVQLLANKPAIDSNQAKAVAGGQVAVSGQGYAPGTKVEIWLHSDPVLLTTVTTDESGAFAVTVTLPAGVIGDHNIVATGAAPDGSTLKQQQPITIAAVDPATGTAGTGGGTGGVLAELPVLTDVLPRTGAGIAAIAGAGLLAAGAGAALRLAGRRRRSRAER